MNHSITGGKNIGSLALNPPQNLSLLFDQFNSSSNETSLHDDDVDKINNWISANTKNS